MVSDVEPDDVWDPGGFVLNFWPATIVGLSLNDDLANAVCGRWTFTGPVKIQSAASQQTTIVKAVWSLQCWHIQPTMQCHIYRQTVYHQKWKIIQAGWLVVTWCSVVLQACMLSAPTISQAVKSASFCYHFRYSAQQNANSTQHAELTHSTPAVLNCCCSKASAPYWSNPPFIIFDIRALWCSVMSVRAPKCQKLKMVG